MVRDTIGGKVLNSIKNRGILAWLIMAALLALYITLYFTAELDGALTGLFGVARSSAWYAVLYSRWTLYGMLYTIGIVFGGAYMFYKYRHNKYQIVRTSVVIFVQVFLAFSLPSLLKFLGQPDYYFSYLWPLKIDYFYPQNILHQPMPFVIYSFVGALVAVPILTIFFGKRWYCSWVCGCGGLANTFGEPWRHLSIKSAWAWRFEKFSIHTVLLVAILTTMFVMLRGFVPGNSGLAEVGYELQTWYGLIVVAVLSGVLGTALYPIGGTRVWCRFFCPMAALLGLIQKLGRFRITVKRDMCISCGMCSTYCEMGIDVRAYAQANKSFTRASCVGCGICSEVCPRGVLRLENKWRRDPQELSMSSFIDESWKRGQTAVSYHTDEVGSLAQTGACERRS